jgi:hypothetical protein
MSRAKLAGQALLCSAAYNLVSMGASTAGGTRIMYEAEDPCA